MKDKDIPKVVIKRLPRYYRYLEELSKKGVKRISSERLGKQMNVTASQIRQDLWYFGKFGQQDYGYNVEELYEKISEILGLDKPCNMIIVGGGNLGRALASFEWHGFIVKGIFDVNPRLKSLTVHGIEIHMIEDMENFIKTENIQIAVLSLPESGAEEAARLIIQCGIRAIWNFTALDLNVPSDVCVENVRLTDSLMQISYYLTRRKAEQTEYGHGNSPPL